MIYRNIVTYSLSERLDDFYVVQYPRVTGNNIHSLETYYTYHIICIILIMTMKSNRDGALMYVLERYHWLVWSTQ